MVKFAPLMTAWPRRFQTLGAAYFVFSFVFCAMVCQALFVVSFFTRFWPLPVLYMVYLYLDWDTPNKGGRPIFSIRNWTIWRGLRDYFPFHMHKTVDLDPHRNYMLVCHPHGVLCPGTFIAMTSICGGITELFPGFNHFLTMLPFWFRIPIHRDYLMAGGLVSSSKRSLSYLFSNKKGGNLVAVLPGGAPESLDARPGDIKIIVRQRMGFIKMAKIQGVPLVPCFAFGDHEVFDQAHNPPGSRLRKFQEAAMKYFDVAFPFFSGRGFFQYDFGLLPHRRPLDFVVGTPIEVEKDPNPSSSDLEELRELYIQKMQELFEKHRKKYLDDKVKLIIT